MKSIVSMLIASAILMATLPAAAEVTVGRSTGASCQPLIATIKPRWMDVRDLMQPPSGDIDNPKSEHFVCIPPSVTQNAVERRVTTNADLKCYSARFSKGLGICCDGRLTACVQLNPMLFPELQRQRKEEAYEPPKSDWVRPPSDGDQWGTN